MSTPPEVLPIESRDQYYAYMDEIDGLCRRDPPCGSPEGERLLALAAACEDYEATNWPGMFPAHPPDEE